MSTSESPPRARRSKWRRRLLVLATFVAFVWGAEYVVEYYVLDVDRYRDLLIDEVASASALPTHIERLDLSFLPTPHLNALGVTVGEGHFQATANRVTLHVELLPLMDRILHITNIELYGLELRVPDSVNDLEEKLNSLVDALNEPVEDALLESSSVDVISARDGKIYLGDEDHPFLTLDAQGHDILSSSITVDLTSDVHRLGESAELNGTLRFELGEGGVLSEIVGEADYEGADLSSLWEGAPEDSVFDGHLQLGGDSWERIKVEAKGELHSSVEPALSGTYAGDVWLGDESTTVNNIEWSSESAKVTADLTVYDDGRIALNAKSGVLEGDALRYVSELVGIDEDIKQLSEAKFEAENMTIAWDEEGVAQIASGVGVLENVDLLFSGDPGLLRNVQGRWKATSAGIDVEHLTAQGATLAGLITLDFASNVFGINLTGSLDLAKFQFLDRMSTAVLQRPQGQFEFTHLSGTFSPDNDWADDFRIEGRLTGGSFALDTGAFVPEFESVTGSVQGKGRDLDIQIASASSTLGNISLEGTYHLGDDRWKGQVQCNVPNVAHALINSESTLDSLADLFDYYGDALFDHELTPTEDGKSTLEFSRVGSSPLTGTLLIDPESKGIESADVHAVLPVSVLDRATPSEFTSTGDCTVELTSDPKGRTFQLHADLSETVLLAGDLFKKTQGDPLSADVTGTIDEAGWTLRQLEIHLQDEVLPFTIDGERLFTDSLDLSLAALNPYLTREAELTGQLTGRLGLAPFELDATIHHAGLRLDEEFSIDSVDGPIRYDADGFSSSGIEVVASETNFSVSAHKEGDTMMGEVTGSSLHAEKFADLYERIAALFEGENEDKVATEIEPAADETVVASHFDVKFDKVLYGRGQLDYFRAQVLQDDAGVHIEEISCRPYSGSITGRIDVGVAENDEQPLSIRLEFDTIHTRIFDDCFLEEPQGVEGVMTGSLHLDSTMGDYKHVLGSGTGEVIWTARDGTFGKMGWTTKLLAVLGTTDLVRLKMPSLRDQGLKYEICSGKLVITDGVMSIEQAALASPSYSMDARGGIDFAQNSTDIRVRVQPLETINRLARRLGPLKNLVALTTSAAKVRVHFTGSPYDSTAEVDETENSPAQ